MRQLLLKDVFGEDFVVNIDRIESIYTIKIKHKWGHDEDDNYEGEYCQIKLFSGDEFEVRGSVREISEEIDHCKDAEIFGEIGVRKEAEKEC